MPKNEPKLTSEQRERVRSAFKKRDPDNVDEVDISQDMPFILDDLGFSLDHGQLKDLRRRLDPDGDGYVEWKRFEAVIGELMSENDHFAIIQETFLLLASADASSNGERKITLSDLRKTSAIVKEQFTTAELQEMLEEADKDRDGALNLSEFAQVMKRAGMLS